MRDAALIATLGVLLAAVLAQPFIGVLLWNWIAFMNPHRLAYGLATELPWAAMILAATLLGCVMAGELRSQHLELRAHAECQQRAAQLVHDGDHFA